jgi:hypothetical protein
MASLHTCRLLVCAEKALTGSKHRVASSVWVGVTSQRNNNVSCDSEVCHSHVYCAEAADGTAVEFSLPNSKNFVC